MWLYILRLIHFSQNKDFMRKQSLNVYLFHCSRHDCCNFDWIYIILAAFHFGVYKRLEFSHCIFESYHSSIHYFNSPVLIPVIILTPLFLFSQSWTNEGFLLWSYFGRLSLLPLQWCPDLRWFYFLEWFHMLGYFGIFTRFYQQFHISTSSVLSDMKASPTRWCFTRSQKT